MLSRSVMEGEKKSSKKEDVWSGSIRWKTGKKNGHTVTVTTAQSIYRVFREAIRGRAPVPPNYLLRGTTVCVCVCVTERQTQEDQPQHRSSDVLNRSTSVQKGQRSLFFCDEMYFLWFEKKNFTLYFFFLEWLIIIITITVSYNNKFNNPTTLRPEETTSEDWMTDFTALRYHLSKAWANYGLGAICGQLNILIRPAELEKMKS